MKIEKIFLTPHFHFDFEWWKEEPYHEMDTQVIIDEALNMLDKHPEFTYVFDSVLPLKLYIENRKDGLERIKNFLEQGRVEIVGGDIVAPDEVLPIGEALIKQFEEGQAWLKEVFGVHSTVAWEIDEFAHPARMPQILAPLGFKYFVFARGVKPFDAMHPTLFNWKDPSGHSEIKSYWWAAHYEGSMLPNIIEEKSKKKLIKRFFKEMESRIKFEGERSPVPYLMIPLGGDFVIPNSLWIDFVNKWNKEKDIKLEFSTPTKYFEEVEEYEIPEYTGLFPHVFDGYFTCREKEKQAARKNANSLVSQEKLLSLLKTHGLNSIGNNMQEAWWEVLKGDFHDTIAGTGTDRVYRKTMSRYANSEAIQNKTESKLVNHLESVLNENTTYTYNSLNWEREDVIDINGEEKLVKSPPLSISKLGNKIIDFNPISTDNNSIENENIKIEVDHYTGKVSIFDKNEGTAILKDVNKTSIIDDVGNLWVTRSSNKKYPIEFVNFSVNKKSDLTGEIVIKERNDFVDITKYITLNSNSKCVKFKTEIDFKGKDKRIDIQFPFEFEGKWYTENIFHVEEVEDGIYPVQNFALFEGDSYKAALINKGIPGYSLNGTIGSIMLMRSVSVFSWALVRWVIKNLIPIIKHFSKAIKFIFNKLNIIEFPIYPIHNLFLRTFASEGDLLGHGAMNPASHKKANKNSKKESLAWERGHHSFEYALLLDVEDKSQAVKAGLEFNNPIWHKEIDGRGSNDSISFLNKEIKDVIISSVKPHNNGWLIRIYEPQGANKTAELSIGFSISKAYKLNGVDSEMTELICENNTFKYDLKPFEIIQVYITK